MPLHRFIKQPKIINHQMLFMRRREPYKPIMKDKHIIENRVKLEIFEKQNAEGLMFVPDNALPPWKKSLTTNSNNNNNNNNNNISNFNRNNKNSKGKSMNFRGFRVRVVDRQDEPGFPTAFR